MFRIKTQVTLFYCEILDFRHSKETIYWMSQDCHHSTSLAPLRYSTILPHHNMEVNI